MIFHRDSCSMKIIVIASRVMFKLSHIRMILIKTIVYILHESLSLIDEIKSKDLQAKKLYEKSIYEYLVLKIII